MDDDAYAATPLRQPPAREYGAHEDFSLRQPTSEEKSLALICHLGGFFTCIILPLILWRMKKDESKFIDHHSKEAVNFQLTQLVFFGLVGLSYGLLMTAAMVLRFAANATPMAVSSMLAIPVMVPFVLAIVVLGVLEVVLVVLACTASGRGEYYRYPVCIRFL